MSLAIMALLSINFASAERDGNSCRLTASSGTTKTVCKAYEDTVLTTCQDSSQDPTVIDCATISDAELTNPTFTDYAMKSELETSRQELLDFTSDEYKLHIAYGYENIARAQVSSAIGNRINTVKEKMIQYEKDLEDAKDEYKKAKADYMPAEEQYEICAINWGWIFKYFCTFEE